MLSHDYLPSKSNKPSLIKKYGHHYFSCQSLTVIVFAFADCGWFDCFSSLLFINKHLWKPLSSNFVLTKTMNYGIDNSHADTQHLRKLSKYDASIFV